MKIAFIVNIFPTLSESFILNQITGIIDQGHLVNIYAQQASDEEKMHPDYLGYSLDKRTIYQPKPPKSKLFSYFLAFKTILSFLIKKPSTFPKLINLIYQNRSFSLYQFVKFVEPFYNNQYDVVHCHFGPTGFRGLWLKKLGLCKKLITTFHGYDINRYPKEHGNNVYDKLFRYGDIFTANTNYTKKKMVLHNCPAEKIHIVPIGVNLEKFKFRSLIPPTENHIILLSVGRLVEKKGQQYALAALAKVINTHPNIIYRIIGDGPLQESIVNLAEELGISDHVEMPGAMVEKDIIQEYNKAHIFILPSVTAEDGDEEGQALVVQEAQAVGLPVIATNHNGVPDGLIDGETGHIVPEKDEEELANKIIYLIDNQSLWLTMGKRGRAFVEQKYDIRLINKRIVKLYSFE